jgi:hypothetical protein
MGLEGNGVDRREEEIAGVRLRGLVDPDRVFLRAPEKRQFDSFGKSLRGKLRRLACSNATELFLPAFSLWDRLFWILLSRWWSQWREPDHHSARDGLALARREGWSALGNIEHGVPARWAPQGFQRSSTSDRADGRRKPFGVRRGSTVNISCSVSASSKPSVAPFELLIFAVSVCRDRNRNLYHGLLGLELTAYCFFGVTSIKGIAPPVTLGILPFHF